MCSKHEPVVLGIELAGCAVSTATVVWLMAMLAFFANLVMLNISKEYAHSEFIVPGSLALLVLAIVSSFRMFAALENVAALRERGKPEH